MSGQNLLAGPDPRTGAEGAAAHRARLGALPPVGTELLNVLDRSGLRGRGGGAFPVGAKWRAVARGAQRPVVLVNGAEGEPLSHKDRMLMECRPHLVLDGAALAARVLGADEVILYIGADHRGALRTLRLALAERDDAERRRTRIVGAPARYVAGEESAAVHFVEDGVALPTTMPPRPFERGVDGRPTLVQNVESLAHVAMLARFGDAWFRGLGRGDAAGTALLTVSGAVAATVVLEVAQGTTVAEAVAAAGGTTAAPQAVLVGGYFGGWMRAGDAWPLPLDGAPTAGRGLSPGCGVVAVLPEQRCGAVETARIMGWLAEQSARQCGPCVFGLRAIADAVGRVAACRSVSDDLVRITRWSGELRGRGACRHPDGAAILLQSALRVFSDELALHHERRHCSRSAVVEAA